MTPMRYATQYQPVRRMLRQEVLYLMVVRMPSEEDIRAAKMEMEKKGEKVQEVDIGEVFLFCGDNNVIIKG